MPETEFWRDLKPIASVFKADALPEVLVSEASRRLRATGGPGSFADAAEEPAAGSELVLEAHDALLRG
jgi:hypothetical protein